MTRILVVDDDENVLKVLSRALERFGYEVLTAKDGRECVTMFQSSPTDLVICDIFMPRMDGLEVLMQLRKSHPDVKLIAVSGGGVRMKLDVLPLAEILGADATLEKPYDIDDLLRTIRRLISDNPQPSAS